MTTRRTLRTLSVLIPLALTGALLSGCSGSGDDPTDDAPAGPPPASAAPVTGAPSATADAGGFPTCDEVKAALGPEVAGLVELADSENGVATGSDGPALGCAWHTKETADSSIDLEEYGGLSLGISRDPEYTEESMEPLGWNVEDGRVAAAGAWALKVGGGYDPAEQLDVTGVQVVRDGVVVVLTSGGVALQDVPQLAALTNEWALGAGVAALDLMD
ncbi:hypothetical protein [Herbiconiux sp. YIM B11900]|uniref:hypothetical protein n=1 Tax=Herbiconiux sp. YIM B11900 TaxID=3404131 RepID=UPI003F85BFF4